MNINIPTNCCNESSCLLSQCAFLVWCMNPGPSNGSVQIYNRIIKPFFLKNEAKIDGAVKNLTDKASEAADKIKDEGEWTDMETRFLEIETWTILTF